MSPHNTINKAKNSPVNGIPVSCIAIVPTVFGSVFATGFTTGLTGGFTGLIGCTAVINIWAGTGVWKLYRNAFK